MQWRRRHCCTHIVGLFVVLTFLGIVVILGQQEWLPSHTSLSWWRGHPVDHAVGRGRRVLFRGEKGNQSTRQTVLRAVLSPPAALRAEGNASSGQGSEGSPLKVVSGLNHSLVANGSHSGEEGLSGLRALEPYRYIIDQHDKCLDDQPPPFLVLLIATEARQVEARNAIRQTWGNESVAPGVGFLRLFLLGVQEGELGRLQQAGLEAESRRHRDIIQHDYLDSYHNLTIKTLMGMSWVATHCPHAAYVMKTDSDMFVNTDYLVNKLLRPELRPRQEYFTGYLMRGYKPNRNQKSKWYMSPEAYPSKTYPTFCSGTGYVFSGDLAGKIYGASLGIRRLHLEDVYVGICLAKLRLEPEPPPNGFLFNHWRVSYTSCRYSHLITSHQFHPNELLKYWQHLQANKQNACLNSSKDKGGRFRQ